MRTTVDLPDPLFQDLKLAAARRGVSLKTIIHDALVKELLGEAPPKLGIKRPLIPANGRRPYNLTNAEIEDLLT